MSSSGVLRMLRRCHIVLGSLCCVSLMLTGCNSPSVVQEGKKIASMQIPQCIAGRVESVNREQRYIILRCSIAPPVGSEATVYRDHKKVAQVKFSSVRDYPCVSADILSGLPAIGDLLVY